MMPWQLIRGNMQEPGDQSKNRYCRLMELQQPSGTFSTNFLILFVINQTFWDSASNIIHKLYETANNGIFLFLYHVLWWVFYNSNNYHENEFWQKPLPLLPAVVVVWDNQPVETYRGVEAVIIFGDNSSCSDNVGNNGTQTLCFVQILFIKFVTVSQQPQTMDLKAEGPPATSGSGLVAFKSRSFLASSFCGCWCKNW